MRAHWIAAMLVVTLAAHVASVAEAQDASRVLEGLVQDSTGEPIPFAQVTVRRAGLRVTNDSGHFRFVLPDIDEIELRVRRIGFRPVERTFVDVPDGALVIVMAPVGQSLAAVRIEADAMSRSLELHGFYQRLADRETGLNSGYFVTPEDIERRRAVRASFLLEGIPAVRVVRTSSSGTRYGVVGSNGCPMTVYLDNIRLNSLAGRYADVPPDLDAVLTPTAVAGMEVYTRRTNVPAGFQMLNGTCGVVLIWTR